MRTRGIDVPPVRGSASRWGWREDWSHQRSDNRNAAQSCPEIWELRGRGGEGNEDEIKREGNSETHRVG